MAGSVAHKKLVVSLVPGPKAPSDSARTVANCRKRATRSAAPYVRTFAWTWGYGLPPATRTGINTLVEMEARAAVLRPMILAASLMVILLPLSADPGSTAPGSRARTELQVQPEQVPAGAPGYQDEWYLQPDDGASSLLVREYGEGDPVVVLHGGWGAEHSYLLDAIWPHRAEHRFVMYDQRGSLRSPARTSTITLQRHVADLDNLREELGLERMTILAHSMGTYLAMTYAQQHPERVERLVLTGAVPPVFQQDFSPNEVWGEYAQEMMQRPEVQAILEAEGLLGPDLSDREQTHAWRVRFASVNLAKPERWRQFRGGRVFYSQAAADAVLPSMPMKWDFSDLLVRFPVSVVNGDQDYVDPGAEGWNEADPGDSLLHIEVLEQAGHSAWIDQPAAFYEAVHRALARD